MIIFGPDDFFNFCFFVCADLIYVYIIDYINTILNIFVFLKRCKGEVSFNSL